MTDTPKKRASWANYDIRKKFGRRSKTKTAKRKRREQIHSRKKALNAELAELIRAYRPPKQQKVILNLRLAPETISLIKPIRGRSKWIEGLILREVERIHAKHGKPLFSLPETWEDAERLLEKL